MGRRPNAVVLEFFERGQKLADASNRYEHTCRKCGEIFPKGRPDSLIGHILRRCPNATQDDRDLVTTYLRQTATDRELQASVNPANGVFTNHVLDESPGTSQILREVLHNQRQEQQQSALDTLAEVSRQQLDYAPYRAYEGPGPDRSAHEDGHESVERTLLAHLQHASNESSGHDTEGLAMYAQAVESYGSRGQAGSSSEHDVVAATPLMQAASAANEHLERTQSSQSQPIRAPTATVDPQLDKGVFGPFIPTDLPGPANPEGHVSWESGTNGDLSMQAFGRLLAPATDMNSAMGLLTNSPVRSGKVRNRFTDSRRKEVSMIRKRGACIRCRMLKKPCSDGTPCETCARVESARLWKGRCLRSRVADECTLWSSGLFHSRASVSVASAVYGLGRETLTGCIELRPFQFSDACMTFACKRYNVPDLSTTQHDLAIQPPPEQSSLMLLDESEAMSIKIQAYVNCIAREFSSAERDSFIGATLQQVLGLAQEEEGHVEIGRPVVDGLSGRSCYNLQEQLAKNVLELWIETTLLAAPDRTQWQLQYNACTQPQQHSLPGTWTKGTQDMLVTAIAPESLTGCLITSQVLAATESRCSRLSQNIMHELERRLLQRRQVSRFATFISAILLLSCVERMTGLYHTFDTTTNASSISEGPSDTFVDWPLDRGPSTLWKQGRQFADLLIMLLRMRGLQPETVCDEAATLTVEQNKALPVGMNGRPLKAQNDEMPQAAAAWLDPIRLNVADILAKKHRPESELSNGVEAFDMRFTADLLLPLTMNE